MELHLNQTGLIVHTSSSLLKLKTPVPRRRTEGHCIPIFVLLPNVVTLKKKITIPFLFHTGLDIKPGLLRLLKCKLLL